MITWITEQIAIGEWLDSHNLPLLVQERIDCVLNLDSRQDEYELGMQGIIFCHLKVGDHQGLTIIKIELQSAVYMLKLLVKQYDRILVHCIAGIDRSPFVVARYLQESDGLELGEAYKLIKEKRPWIAEHYEWV